MRIRNHMKLSLSDQLLKARVAIEKVKLAKLEGDRPKATPQYTRYEDLPPPSPEEQDRFYERLEKTIGRIEVMTEAEVKTWEQSNYKTLPEDIDARIDDRARPGAQVKRNACD